MLRVLSLLSFVFVFCSTALAQGLPASPEQPPPPPPVKERKLIEYVDGRRGCAAFWGYSSDIGIIIERKNPDGELELTEIRKNAYRGAQALPPLQPGQTNQCPWERPAFQMATIEIKDGRFDTGFLIEQNEKYVEMAALPNSAFEQKLATKKLNRKDVKAIYLFNGDGSTSTSNTGAVVPVVYIDGFAHRLGTSYVREDYHRFGCSLMSYKVGRLPVPVTFAFRSSYPCKVCKAAYLDQSGAIIDPLKDSPELAEEFEWRQATVDPDDASLSLPSSVRSYYKGSSKHTPGTDVRVTSYRRKDGTYVRSHARTAPGRGSSSGRSRRP